MVRTTRSGPVNGDASGSRDHEQQQQQQPDIMNQFAQLLQNLTATVQPPQPRGPPPCSSIFSKFRRQRPPVFSGEPDPQVANRWIRQIKKMLETTDVRANNDKIALATYQLEGEADHCEASIGSGILKLETGNNDDDSIHGSFEELSRHASKYIPTDEKKARQFEWGLDLTLRERVVRLRLRTFAEVVEVALIHEREIMDARKISNQQKMTSGGPIRNNNNKAFVNKKPYDN
ncbi:hypothetical protein Vadar_025575 [Vaccinium darrowii]|uniref:Uncharacterized protein n=1 Tax=Vaccinium darrowii TaxID=229202 RepID=A0ACB7YG21_9ERIC|nr:hypothetical protein Vadar_025575 [Vaccinium darrowii]